MCVASISVISLEADNAEISSILLFARYTNLSVVTFASILSDVILLSDRSRVSSAARLPSTFISALSRSQPERISVLSFALPDS